MKAEKKASATLEQNLLEAQGGASFNGKLSDTPQNSEDRSGFLHFCKIILLCLTCGCFCGGKISLSLSLSLS